MTETAHPAATGAGAAVYTLTFVADGLPSGREWSVEISAYLHYSLVHGWETSTGPSIVFEIGGVAGGTLWHFLILLLKDVRGAPQLEPIPLAGSLNARSSATTVVIHFYVADIHAFSV